MGGKVNVTYIDLNVKIGGKDGDEERIAMFIELIAKKGKGYGAKVDVVRDMLDKEINIKKMLNNKASKSC